MAHIIKFPLPFRRATPPSPPQKILLPSSTRVGVNWLGVFICVVLGAALIPLTMILALLWPFIKFFLGVYILSVLIAMLFGGTKWLLIGLAHFGLLGALTFLFGTAKRK